MSYTFKTVSGKTYTVESKDGDRARCAAKKAALAAGDAWPGARLVKMTNALG